MSRPWSVVVSLCLFSKILGGCVSTQTRLEAKAEPDVLQRRIQTWLGLSRDFLEQHWGIAQDTKDMGAGLRYLEYVPSGGSGRTKRKKKTKDAAVCHVVFTVDISGTVRGGQWTGDRTQCMTFVKGVPPPAPQQTLVSF